jgi:hypothetical protein
MLNDFFLLRSSSSSSSSSSWCIHSRTCVFAISWLLTAIVAAATATITVGINSLAVIVIVIVIVDLFRMFNPLSHRKRLRNRDTKRLQLLWKVPPSKLRLDLRENGLVFDFPYVCPEPVLVKRSFLCINGQKRPFSHLVRAVQGVEAICAADATLP